MRFSRNQRRRLRKINAQAPPDGLGEFGWDSLLARPWGTPGQRKGFSFPELRNRRLGREQLPCLMGASSTNYPPTMQFEAF